MTRSTSRRVPGLWRGLAWAIERGAEGGGISRARLIGRTLGATLTQRRALHRWMQVVYELKSRHVIDDLPGEYLRAIRPYVHRHTGVGERVVQLIDHVDWMETAFKPAALEKLYAGQPVVLAELPAPRNYDFMRLQLQRAPSQAPEGELVLTLTLQRSSDLQHKAQPVDAAALGFSRFRVDGLPCFVIGGVRGQRHPVLRLSPVEVSNALAGWKPSVLMVRVAQELARHWGLHLIGLNPASHRLQGWSYQLDKRKRETMERIYASYDALWEHFEAKKGPPGWMILPLNSDDKLEATALSPEKRLRQTQRADYWIRTRNLMRAQIKEQLLRPGREARLSRVTESMGPSTMQDFDSDFEDSEDVVPSRVLQTGPGSLI
jgi:uncharacterized protein VirK/YbjX